jgi:hypothetical protein
MRDCMIALAIALAGCSGRSPEIDCAAIVRDPAQGLAAVMGKVDDPARVWDVLERCFAPNGDTCERAAVGGAMVPSMSVSDGSAGDAAKRAEDRRQWAARCRTLPADQQRCLLMSHAIGHPECMAIAEQLRRTLQASPESRSPQ